MGYLNSTQLKINSFTLVKSFWKLREFTKREFLFIGIDESKYIIFYFSFNYDSLIRFLKKDIKLMYEETLSIIY